MIKLYESTALRAVPIICPFCIAQYLHSMFRISAHHVPTQVKQYRDTHNKTYQMDLF